jgi:hypothetical protein
MLTALLVTTPIDSAAYVPAERIRDLRRTETVILGGRVLSSRALYRAAGLEPR